MASASATANGFGKRAGSQAGESFPQIGETNRSVINAINEMYADAAVVFGRWLGITDKTAKRKLNLERRLDVEELGALIRSERGFEIVAAVMGNAKPAWWRIVVPLMDAADARKMQLAARRRLEKTIESVVDADRLLTATIQRAEALQDQEHAGPHVDALRAMARVQDSAVAPTKGQRR